MSILQRTVNGYEGDRYVVGDLLWVKIGQYPFWPCMVSYDPFEGIYSKMKRGRNGEIRIYHVQYFGTKVDRGWTAEQIFLFDGFDQYKERKGAKYNIPSSFEKEWIHAVAEAEEALTVHPLERFETYVFKYDKKCRSNGSVTSVKSENYKPPVKRRKISCDKGNKEKICKMCEEGNADVTCNGYCSQSFHQKCLGLLKVPDGFKCVYCDLGLYSCVICKMAEISLTKCIKCNNYYHDACLKDYQCADVEKRICPAHMCITCYNENPRHVSCKGLFTYCFRCPNVFHSREICIPADADLLTASVIICPDHYLGKKRISNLPPVNVVYCSICSDGGLLICCEGCPNAFHSDCINEAIIPDEYLCEVCRKKSYLYNGMIVWARVGNFRWWPAQIVPRANTPVNIRNMYNFEGEFVICFFGTNEYTWTHRGRVIPYAEHHKALKKPVSNPQSNLARKFNLGLKYAADAYNKYIQQCIIERQLSSKPDAYKHIRVNRAVPPAQIFVKDSKSFLPCTCVPEMENPCDDNSFCLNRSLLMECHPDVCRAKERCGNQKFQKRQYASLKLIMTKNCGWGLKSCDFIKKGSFVIEYVGEVITHEEYRRRVKKMREDNIKDYYFLYLDSRRMIDAGPKGNLARFMNHSCNPNCEMVKWSVNGDARIGIFALIDIEPGQELSFHYQSDSIQFEQKCHCEAANCEGFIGRNGKKNGKNK